MKTPRSFSCHLFASACLLLWAAYALAGDRIILAMYSGDCAGFLRLEQGEFLRKMDPAGLHSLFRKALSALTAVSAGCFLVPWIYRKYGRDTAKIAAHALPVCVFLACSITYLFPFYRIGYEASWYRFDAAMEYSLDPPFRHRILFILVAKLLKSVFPGLSPIACFQITQSAVILSMFYLIKKWAEMFVDKTRALLAQPLLLAMIIPMITYFDFYDLGIVVIFTLCLMSLFKRRLPAYLALFTAGALNHEVTLLLVPVSALVLMGDRTERRKVFVFLGLQLALFFAVKTVLFITLPVATAYQTGRFWFNMTFLFEQHHIFFRPKFFLVRALPFLLWTAAALLGSRSAPRDLRKCLVLLPLILLTTLFFGKLNELRQFYALTPLFIALIISSLKTPKAGTDYTERLP